ncbi:MEDS domain-containing protein [Streptomyces sp. NPDC048290]|uniref:MEDS domain-containing protein n=1 Tax=Streptomyces sp. NPDC048290 TaxID=3155811 RepID=UPI0034296DC2
MNPHSPAAAATSAPPGLFDHRMAVFGTDEEFLAAAVPFLTEGLRAPGEPAPTAITTPARLALLADALGDRVALIDHTDWYTGSAANAVARSAGHLARHAGAGGRAHLLMEPDWSGRAGSSPRERTEWMRCESLANLLFAALSTTVLCGYDTRIAPPEVIAQARRAHPDTDAYEHPYRLTAALDLVPLPAPPPDARDTTLDALADAAADRGLAAPDARLFAAAVREAAGLLGGARRARLRVWGTAPACVAELRATGRLGDPLAGFVPPPGPPAPEPGQGLWFTRQTCAYVDVRDTTDPDGTPVMTVRVQYGR